MGTEVGGADVVAGKRVVLVVTGGVLGGAEREALQIALYLNRHCGSEVAFCALHGSEGPLREAAARQGLPWYVVDTTWSKKRPRNALALVRAASRLRAIRPDVLLAFTNKPNVVCGLTWKATGAALCVWNQRDVTPTRIFRARTFRRALRQSPLVVTGAHHATDWLVRHWGADPSSMRVAYCRSELPPPRVTREEWRKRLMVREGDLVACMVAHLKPGKDHVTVLSAWRSVVERGNGTRRTVLALAGNDGGTKAALEMQVQELDLSSHVRFLGGVDDVAGLLDAADIGVFCSESEMLPHGVVEPMSSGLPVVGNDIPGIREALGPAAERCLVPSRDSLRLADLILELAGDETLRRALGDENRELAGERYGESAAAHYVELLVSALETCG